MLKRPDPHRLCQQEVRDPYPDDPLELRFTEVVILCVAGITSPYVSLLAKGSNGSH